MKIKKISIKNFRGIKSLEDLELSDFTTIVGKNDAGKSTILYAIRAFIDEKVEETDFYCNMPADEDMEIKISFQIFDSQMIKNYALLDKERLLTIKKYFDFNKKALRKTTYFVYETDCEKYQDLWKKDDTKELDNIINELGLSPKPKSLKCKKIDRIAHIYDHLKKDDINFMDHEHEIDKNLMKEIKASFNMEPPILFFVSADQKLDVNGTEFSSYYKQLFNKVINDNKELINEINSKVNTQIDNFTNKLFENLHNKIPQLKQINPEMTFEIAKAYSKVSLELQTENDSKPIPIENKGAGVRRLVIIALLETIRDVGVNENTIYAIEEPETYLHPSAQKDLLVVLNDLSETSQVIVTTHSPFVAGETPIQSLILVEKHDFCQNYKGYSKEYDLYTKIANDLGVKPHMLQKNADFILFVEGKDDIKFVEHSFMRLTEYNLKDKNIEVIPGSGDNLKSFVLIDYFKQFKTHFSFSVIVDGDKKNNEKLINFLYEFCDDNNGLHPLILPKCEIENYCHPTLIKRYISTITIDYSIIIGLDDQKPIDDQIGLYLPGYPYHGKNVKKVNTDIFEAMSKEQWEEMDKDGKLKEFYLEIIRTVDRYQRDMRNTITQ